MKYRNVTIAARLLRAWSVKPSNEPGHRRAIAFAVGSAIALTAATHAQFCPDGFPQAELPLDCESGAVTCFSGFLDPGDPGAGIDPDGFVVAHVDFRDPATNAPGTGQNWCAPMFHNEFPVDADTWNAANLGQVFGIALDDANPPNIYVTATTTFGSDVASYQNGNTVALPGSPFGPGGSGAVYQLNANTGAIAVFATLPNSGPGLGNLCFDAGLDTFYVSNFEDGRVYRLSSTGACLSTFDHATDTIGSCAPEAGDPDGFAPLRERLWGVATFNGRLYYGLWNEDRGRPNSAIQNEIWSVALDGSGEFVPNSRQLEISIPGISGLNWSNPVSDISFSAAGRMMLAERNMLADVGAGARAAWSQDGHRTRNLEYELDGSNTWVPSGRDFFIGTSSYGPGTNAAGGVGYDCDDNLWSTGDQLLLSGSPTLYTYGLQRTPEAGNTIPTIASTGYFIDLDGISTVQTKNRIGDVAVYNGCCTCMTADVESIDCDFDENGLTGKYNVTMDITNNSGVTAFYVLLPNAETIPHIVPLNPPLPSGTGVSRAITFQICDVEPGTTHCFDLILADEQVEECCTIEVCVELPDCDCMQFSELSVECVNGDLVINFMLSNLSADVFEHVFIFKPLPPDPNSGIIVTPDYFDFSGSPIIPFTTVGIGPITISGAVPGTQLCLLISGHNADLIECCSEELCFEVPECDGTVPTGACCLPDGTCIVTTAAECQAQLGLYLGDDVPCDECDNLEPVGACCLADGSCVQVSAFECGNLMGIYIGDGVPCDECEGVTPRGACCLADGTCVQTSEPGCQSTGGFYLGDDTPCDECQSFFEPGACCLPDGSCVVVPGPKCLGLGGTYLGPGTGCDECPQMFDDCDFNQDGSVDVSDLLILLGNWGPCEECQADLDGDGSVNVNDLLMVLSQWDP